MGDPRTTLRRVKAFVVALLCTLALAGCHRRGPAPAYPVPQDPPPEDTELAPYLESSPDAGVEPAPDDSSVTPTR
jgi:hypothetical protein